MKNSERIFVRALRDYCERKEVVLKSFSHDWIHSLENKVENRLIIGYDVGLNPSTAFSIANDKAATYDVLSSLNIPAVPHHMYLAPRLQHHIGDDGIWRSILEHHEANQCNSVIKPNEGTGGVDVYWVRSNYELEMAVQAILTHERSVAVSPYLNIDREIRVYVLNGRAVLAYEKIRPAIIGDGKSSVAALCLAQHGATALGVAFSDLSEARRRVFLEQIAEKSEILPLSWKHNLGQGSTLNRISIESCASPADLAIKAAGEIGLVFGTVDLVEVAGQFLVLELNKGVMLEHAVRNNHISYDEAYAIYEEALDSLLSAHDGNR